MASEGGRRRSGERDEPMTMVIAREREFASTDFGSSYGGAPPECRLVSLALPPAELSSPPSRPKFNETTVVREALIAQRALDVRARRLFLRFRRQSALVFGPMLDAATRASARLGRWARHGTQQVQRQIEAWAPRATKAPADTIELPLRQIDDPQPEVRSGAQIALARIKAHARRARDLAEEMGARFAAHARDARRRQRSKASDKTLEIAIGARGPRTLDQVRAALTWMRAVVFPAASSRVRAGAAWAWTHVRRPVRAAQKRIAERRALPPETPPHLRSPWAPRQLRERALERVRAESEARRSGDRQRAG